MRSVRCSGGISPHDSRAELLPHLEAGLAGQSWEEGEVFEHVVDISAFKTVGCESASHGVGWEGRSLALSLCCDLS